MTERYIPEPGDRVRVRRWEVPSTEVTGGAQRKLSVEFTGTVLYVDRAHLTELIHFDPDSILVTGGINRLDLRKRYNVIGTGYVFLGQDTENGGSWTLVTEVGRVLCPALT